MDGMFAMRRARLVRAAVLVLLALPLLPACAGKGRPARREEAVLLVRNNLLLPTQLTVYVVSSLGERQRVGNVLPRQTARLSFRAPSISGQYRLLAVADAGAEMASPPLALNGGEMVEWNLVRNTILFLR